MLEVRTDYFTTYHQYYKEKFEITKSIKKPVTNSKISAFTCDGGGYTNRPGLVAKKEELLKAFIYFSHLL